MVTFWLKKIKNGNLLTKKGHLTNSSYVRLILKFCIYKHFLNPIV